MNRKEIDVSEYAGTIIRALRPGILLTTKAGEKINSMVIGWGTLGVNWGRPTFAAYVREGRYTRELLDRNPEFTINVPVGAADPEILRICGSLSGRDLDKISAAHMTPVEAEKVSVPAIKEFPLTLECRLIYRQKQEFELYPEELRRHYPQNVPGTDPLSNRDVHVTYFGEIVSAYILEE